MKLCIGVSLSEQLWSEQLIIIHKVAQLSDPTSSERPKMPCALMHRTAIKIHAKN